MVKLNPIKGFDLIEELLKNYEKQIALYKDLKLALYKEHYKKEKIDESLIYEVANISGEIEYYLIKNSYDEKAKLEKKLLGKKYRYIKVGTHENK